MAVAPTLSIVMPAYNEEGAIAAAVDEVRQCIFPCIGACELIIVNDGSRDRTGPILDELAAADTRLRIIHQPNAGHGPAVRRGMDEADGAWLMLIDSDRQISLEGFGRYWQIAQEHDGLFGIRRQRHDPPLRLVITRLLRWGLRILLGVRLADANVPFKILKREIFLAARTIIPPDSLTPSLLLAAFAVRAGYDIATEPIVHRPRTTGVVSIRRWRLIKFCARSLRQLMAFRKRLGHRGQ